MVCDVVQSGINMPNFQRNCYIRVYPDNGSSGYTASYSVRQNSSTVETFFTEDLVLGDTENKVLGHPDTRLEASLPPQQLFCRMAGSSIQRVRQNTPHWNKTCVAIALRDYSRISNVFRQWRKNPIRRCLSKWFRIISHQPLLESLK